MSVYAVTLQSKKKWYSSSNVLPNLQCLWFRWIFCNGLVLFLSYDHLNEILSTIDDFWNFFHFLNILLTDNIRPSVIDFMKTKYPHFKQLDSLEKLKIILNPDKEILPSVCTIFEISFTF
jgi:hypothetical protein